jgi:hypothetical protein
MRMKNEIERRIDEISREIREYPTPIARCDAQLAGLLEERALLLSRLKAFPEEKNNCSPSALWINDGGFDAA